MAHFAELDEIHMVVRVVVIGDEDTADDEGKENEAIGIAFCETLFGGGTWLQTSYNRQLRKHFAGKGFSYDPDLDIFVPPAPFPSWTRINNENDDWAPPVAWPDDGNFYRWNEDDQQWVLAEDD